MSARLGTLTLDLVAKTGNFVGPIEKAKKKTSKDFKDMEAVAKKLGVAFAALGAAATATFIKLTKDGLASVDAQAKLARSLGTTFDSVTALNKAFNEGGVSNYQDSLSRLNETLGAAALGRGRGLRTVKELGLDLDALANSNADERIAVIADRISAVAKNSAEASRFAKELGFTQKEAGQFFLQGGDAIRTYAERVKALGLSLTEIETSQIEAANDALAIFGDITTSVSQRLAAEAAPLIQAFAKSVEDSIIEMGGLSNVTKNIFDDIVRYTAFTINAVDGVVRVFQIAANSIVATGSAALSVLTRQYANFLSVLNKIPTIRLLIDDETIAGLREFERIQKDVASQALAEVNSLLTDPLAGDALRKRIEQIKKDSEGAAEALIKSRAVLAGGLGSEAPGGGTASQPDLGPVIRFNPDDEIKTIDLIADRYKELEAIAERTSLALRTPQEIFRDEIELLNELRETRQSNSDEMLITQEEYIRGVEQAQDKLAQSVEETTSEMTEFARQAARNMQDAMANGFFDAMQGNLSDLGSNFKKTIDRMVANLLASKLNEFLMGDFASGGALGGIASSLAGFLSFSGGGYTGNGPRSGGMDGQGGFLAMMHPRETVIDHTKMQQGGGSSVINVNISGVKDEGSLRQTASQIASRTASAAQRAVSRNN